MPIALPPRFKRMFSPPRTQENPLLRNFLVPTSEAHLLSDEHIRFLAESLPEIVWTAQPDGRHDFMNRRWFLYTGLTEEETYTETKSAVHPDDFPLYKQRWSESVATGKPYEMEYRFRRQSDGMYRWHIGRALPVRDESGRIIKWFGTCVDIHAQKEAEEQVRHTNDRLESIVLERTKDLRKEIRQRRRAEERQQAQLNLLHTMIDLFPTAAVVVDGRGIPLHANNHFCRLVNIPREVLVGAARQQYLHIHSILRNRFPQEHRDEDIRALLRSDHPRTLELNDDGRTFRLECIPTADESLERGFLLLIRDISQEKKIDAAKSDFMSLASHQLRTLLTSIRWALGRLSRILQGRIEKSEQELLSRARAGAVGMAQTIATMLSISRIEAGLLRVNATDIALPEFFGTLREEYEGSARALSFSVDCPADLRLRADAFMLQEIFDNLLTNAIKYTPAGGSVALSAARDGDHVLLRVRDSGLGIPLHQQKNVFSKFFRGENAAKIDTQGTGLGLYLVSQLVSALGGTITFTSEEGKGTEFTLCIPATDTRHF